MSLVDDDRVVALEEAVVLGFRQQDAVGHQFDQGAGIALILEAHLVAHQRTQGRGQFFGDPAGDTAGGDPPGLGMADQAVLAATDFQADLRQLGGFPRAGLTSDDQHLMLEQRVFDFVALGGDRQAVFIADSGHAVAPRRHQVARRLHPLQPLGELGLVGLLAQFEQLPTQPVAVGEHGLIEVFQ